MISKLNYKEYQCINVDNDLINTAKEYINNTKITSRSGTTLLDRNKNNYSVIEAIANNIVKYLIQKNCFSNDVFVEIWWKNTIPINKFHIDCDENERYYNNKYVYPLLSNVLYFDNDPYPLLLTNITEDKLLFKKFENENDFLLIFPKKLKLISFNSKYCHGIIDVLNKPTFNSCRHALMINIWQSKPLNLEYYNNFDKNDYPISNNMFIIEEIINNIPSIAVENAFHYDVIEQTIFNIKPNLLCCIGNELSNYYGNDFYNKFSNYLIIKNNNTLHKISSILSIDICNKICNEILEKGQHFDNYISFQLFYPNMISILKHANHFLFQNLKSLNIEYVYITNGNKTIKHNIFFLIPLTGINAGNLYFYKNICVLKEHGLFIAGIIEIYNQ